MERKRFMIAMDKKTHVSLKATALNCGLHAGDLIDLLLKSLKTRLPIAYEISGVKDIDGIVEGGMVQTLLDADIYEWSEKKLTQELKNLGKKFNEM